MRKAWAAIAAMVLCASATASAQEVDPDPMPPVKYRALGGVPVVFVPSYDMWRACGMTPIPGRYLFACAKWLPNGKRFIVMPDPCETAHLDQYALIMCHENAHALGDWPGDHPKL